MSLAVRLLVSSNDYLVYSDNAPENTTFHFLMRSWNRFHCTRTVNSLVHHMVIQVQPKASTIKVKLVFSFTLCCCIYVRWTNLQVKDDVQPRPAEGESIQPSTIATTATMSEMESMVSESSSGTSSVSNSLHSTSMESHQSHRSRSDVGPTAPPESLDSWTKGQLIARISSLQDDLRKVQILLPLHSDQLLVFDINRWL